MNPSEKSYRPDIDGLRAIAVCAILLYHVGFIRFGGGFVGVDIFFVISGYLITGQILAANDRGMFSFKSFYDRRIRRLMPAALFTFLATSTAAYVLLIPEQLRDYGASLLSAIFWASNIFFWKSTGYFDLDAHTKPLLHIWSLNVEEQFYLVWPIFLVFFTKRSRIAALIAIATVSFASLKITHFIAIDRDAVFYLMPFRIFEFGIGAALAVPRRLWRHWLLNEIAVLYGLYLILYSVHWYIDTMDFPGSSAIRPCLGAALVIYGGPAKFSGLLLRNPISVWIGRISYSVYLAHWPIIVFYRIVNPGEIPLSAQLAIVAASFVCGAVMYFFIETPFRHGGSQRWMPSRSKFYTFLVTLVVIIGGAGAYMHLDSGWEWRYPSNMRAQMRVNFDKEFAWTNLDRLNQPFTPSADHKMLIVGDSQAGDFLNMLLSVHADMGSEIRTHVIQAECQAIIPRSDDYYATLHSPLNVNCKRYHKEFLASGKIEKADTVVLASNWQPYGLPELSNTIDYFLSHGVKKVFVVGRKDQGLNGQALLRKYWDVEHIDAISAHFRSDEANNINAELRQNLHNATYIDVMSAVCPSADSCLVLTPDKKVIFSDVVHLTQPGTNFMASILASRGAFSTLSR